jgi:hypothetical protein
MPARSQPYYLGLGITLQGCRTERRRIATGNCKRFIYDCYVEDVAEEYGEMAERLNAPDSKSGIPSRVSGVQIPLSPPRFDYYFPGMGPPTIADPVPLQPFSP